MTSERVTIRGTSDGVVINLGAGAWPHLMDELGTHLEQTASFFKGGRVALQVGPRQLNQSQLEAIGQLLNQHNMSLWAVDSDSVTTQATVSALGLETTVGPTEVANASAKQSVAENSVIVQRTLRSGQVVSHPGDVIIMGDVNPGAEVKAGGSIIVWGRLRGIAHAGLGEIGDQAFVCALQLTPTQLRISSHITRSPVDDIDRHTVVPEMASINDGQIVAEPWPN